MNQDHVKGTAEQIKGKIKESVGNLTGNDRLKREGQVDQIKGETHKTVGDVKDAGHDLKNNIDPHKK